MIPKIKIRIKPVKIPVHITAILMKNGQELRKNREKDDISAHQNALLQRILSATCLRNSQ
jgi:hypothetical protein